MAHEPLLIATIAISLTAAFVGGFLARRLRLPVIVGYLVAGVAIGPFTPGLVADPDIATELAEIGVVLLMFGVGIHFSIRDLLAVRRIAIPGAVGQIAFASLLGTGLGVAFGWGLGGGVVLGLAISVASTVVLLRALMDRNELESVQGRIAVGWLIVEDLFTVVVLVLLPSLAPLLGGAEDPASTGPAVVGELVVVLGRAGLFAALMIYVGTRLVPWLLVLVAREGSRELFTLAVLAFAVGLAFVSSAVFGVSLALGAFLAGLVIGESDMSHQAAADALPLQDAFAVLFFVSIGMLLDPSFLVAQPTAILMVVLVVVVAKSAVAFAIVAAFGYPLRTGLTVAAGLAQIGEFSFILATAGQSLGLLPPDGFQVIVAGAMLSITLNPFVFRLIEPVERRFRLNDRVAAYLERRAGDLAYLAAPDSADGPRLHAILCGYGRVGRMIGPALERRGFRYVVISLDRREVEALRARGVAAVYGDAANADVLRRAHIATARVLIAAISDLNATRLIVDRARSISPTIDLVVRTHDDSEAAHLRSAGGNVQAVYGERELAIQMARATLRRFGVSGAELDAIAQGLRGHRAAPSRPPTPDLGIVGRIRRSLRSAMDGPGQ